MDMIGEFVGRLFLELHPFVDWLLRHWAVTMSLLAALIYWAGHQRRIDRRRL